MNNGLMIIENDRWCVYAHISPSGKYYVGITSQKPTKRWQNGHGYKDGIISRAIKKYGWDNFQHEIIASNLTEAEAKRFEIVLIEKLHSNDSQYGYNISPGGDGNKGLVHSAETKQKIGMKSKEYYRSHKHPKCKPVYQFDLDGNFIKEYASTHDVEKQTGISRRNIAGVCNGKAYISHGYCWAYKESVDDLIEFRKHIPMLMKSKNKNYGKHSQKPVNLYDLTGNFIAKFDSVIKLANYLNVHDTAVCNACKKGAITCGKFRCEYA